MVQNVPRARADSGGSGRLSRESLDASISGDDTHSVDDGGGALDALWRLEETHHFLLNQQLAGTHRAFVDDLYAALETTRDALEQQSVRVLAVLHDKDARILQFDEAALTAPEKADFSVQVGPRKKHESTQSDSHRNDETHALHDKVSEQEEQIDVLLDELERVQRVVSEMEQAEKGKSEGVAKATQTESLDPHMETSKPLSDQAFTALAAMQRQLDAVERSNAELRAALEQNQTKLFNEPASEEKTMDAVERQLEDAIHRMEIAAQCRVVSWSSLDENEHAMPCLDLEHELQVGDFERTALMDEILTLRKALLNGTASLTPAPVNVPSTRDTLDCSSVTCHHTLRRILRHVQAQRGSQSKLSAKVLRSELRHALRGRREEERAAVVARVVVEWMRWEAAHADEIASLRHAQAHQLELQGARVANLMDTIHRLNQQTIDLQTELKVLARQRTVQAATPEDCSENAPTVESDRRVLELEQSLRLKQEQLDVANRAIHAMSFASDQAAPSSSLSGKHQIAQLSIELQALQENNFRRFQPTDTSRHAVVEYFRLEKECLRLKHRLKDKDERIQQLEVQCEQLEQTARRVYSSNESREAVAAIWEAIAREQREKTGAPQQGMIERYYLRLLEKRNEDLWLEMAMAKRRIGQLERELAKKSGQLQSGAREDDSKLVRDLALRIEEFHRGAFEAFQAWPQNMDREGSRQRERATTSQANLVLTAYGILLGHYETLSLQLRLFQTVTISHPTARTSDSTGGVSRRWHLLERIHVFEDRLLEVQSCLGCGGQVVKKREIKTKSAGIVTDVLTTLNSATQVSDRDRMRRNKSKGIQVDLKMAPFHCEQPQVMFSDDPVTGKHTTPETAHENEIVNDMQRQSSNTQLSEIQRQLEISLARIDELTAQKQKVKERLDDARQANRQCGKEQDDLRSQVEEISSSNASLSSQLQQYRKTQQPNDLKQATPPQAHAADAGAAHEVKALAVKEQETVELVRQLCEAKGKCLAIERSRDDAEQRARKLEETVKDLDANRAEDQNRHLEEYMAKVNQSLMVIEREKERLARDNQELQSKLQQVERAVAIKDAQGTRTCGTETDPALDFERLLQLPEYHALETRVVMLQNAFDVERQACEDLRSTRDAEQREKARTQEAEQRAIDLKKAALRKLMDEIRSSHELLQQEFEELQVASAEAKDEADKRIHFLTACVEECSRLVDSVGPHDEIVTSRDMYDTIVTLSKKAGIAPAIPSTPRTGKRPTAAASQEKISSALRICPPTPAPNAKEDAVRVHLHSQLQAETWRIRVAKLESSLQAASLKTKTFEDIVDHLEVQMDGLRDEVKNRMANESVLLTKQGQMKVEITSLKAHSGTLTSRLAEACGELKRSQEASKGTDGEVARLRSALQRKTELLTSQKNKCYGMQKALDHALKRITHLEAFEKKATAAQIKLKDQTLQLQELRQQCVVSRDANFELRAQADKQKEQLSELQSRGKALRLDNGMLRGQLRELKKEIREDAETVFKSHASDVVTAAAAALGDGKTLANLTPTAAVDMLASQVKTLKRRVLQKQDVIIAYKTKLSELDAELTLQRTRLFELSQAYRQFQQSQREKEQSLVQGATQLKEDLELSLLNTAEQLDGLRASIFDACEVFVQCEPPHGVSSPSAAASRTWPEDTEDEELSRPKRGDTDDDTVLQDVRRYAQLSPADLADLHLTSPKRTQQEQPPRLDREFAAHAARQHGARMLRDLEHALEVAPHDCRREICSVLEFLCGHRKRMAAARRY